MLALIGAGQTWNRRLRLPSLPFNRELTCGRDGITFPDKSIAATGQGCLRLS